jgi:hypothetical protein
VESSRTDLSPHAQQMNKLIKYYNTIANSVIVVIHRVCYCPVLVLSTAGSVLARRHGFPLRVPLLCSAAAQRSRPSPMPLRTAAVDGSQPTDPARSPGHRIPHGNSGTRFYTGGLRTFDSNPSAGRVPDTCTDAAGPDRVVVPKVPDVQALLSCSHFLVGMQSPPRAAGRQ